MDKDTLGMIFGFCFIALIFWWGRNIPRRTEEKANQGDARSQYWLAQYYSEGVGGGVSDYKAQASPPDYVTAYAWAYIAELNGYQLNMVAPLRRRCEGKLTPEQISEAEELATEMIEENPKLIGE